MHRTMDLLHCFFFLTVPGGTIMYNEDFLIKILCEITDGAPWKHRNMNSRAKKLACTHTEGYIWHYMEKLVLEAMWKGNYFPMHMSILSKILNQSSEFPLLKVFIWYCTELYCGGKSDVWFLSSSFFFFLDRVVVRRWCLCMSFPPIC